MSQSDLRPAGTLLLLIYCSLLALDIFTSFITRMSGLTLFGNLTDVEILRYNVCFCNVTNPFNSQSISAGFSHVFYLRLPWADFYLEAFESSLVIFTILSTWYAFLSPQNEIIHFLYCKVTRK